MSKPIQSKPVLYSYIYHDLKVIAMKYGYNLVLHGSMSRDLDMIAIPWERDLGNVPDMMEEFAVFVGGKIQVLTEEQKHCFSHGRESWVIDLNRGGYDKDFEKYTPDPQYYLDISVVPTVNIIKKQYSELPQYCKFDVANGERIVFVLSTDRQIGQYNTATEETVWETLPSNEVIYRSVSGWHVIVDTNTMVVVNTKNDEQYGGLKLVPLDSTGNQN